MYKVWWWNKKNNYGDILTPVLFDKFNIPYIFESSYKHADLLCIGSIAAKARKHTTVLGSGFIDSNDRVEPFANYKFVRGPKTRKKILDSCGHCPDIYGDPALLLPLVVDEAKKEHDIGIVPHYTEYNEIKALFPNEFVINLITTDPIKTTKEITSCRKIISSSLHGLIVANAYGIPSSWVKFSNKLVGDDFKFYDHFEAIGMIDARPSAVTDPVFYTGTLDINPIVDIFRTL